MSSDVYVITIQRRHKVITETVPEIPPTPVNPQSIITRIEFKYDAKTK